MGCTEAIKYHQKLGLYGHLAAPKRTIGNSPARCEVFERDRGIFYALVFFDDKTEIKVRYFGEAGLKWGITLLCNE